MLDRKKTITFAAYLLVIILFSAGYVNFLSKNRKPKLTVTSVYSTIADYGACKHQIFTGYIENYGGGEASDVRAFILWSDGENEYKQPEYLGTIPPKSPQSFHIVFNVSDVNAIKWNTHWVEYSNQ